MIKVLIEFSNLKGEKMLVDVDAIQSVEIDATRVLVDGVAVQQEYGKIMKVLRKYGITIDQSLMEKEEEKLIAKSDGMGNRISKMGE